MFRRLTAAGSRIFGRLTPEILLGTLLHLKGFSELQGFGGQFSELAYFDLFSF